MSLVRAIALILRGFFYSRASLALENHRYQPLQLAILEPRTSDSHLAKEATGCIQREVQTTAGEGVQRYWTPPGRCTTSTISMH